MGRFTFEKPPLVEALCEFRFAGGETWDWTVPGRFYGSIALEYPFREEQKFVSVQMTPTEGGVSSGVQGGIERLLFRSAQGNQVVQVGPEFLSVHQTAPYSHWDDFKAEIQRVLQFYWEAAKPGFIVGLSLRYINNVPLFMPKVQWEDLFAIMPNIPDSKDDQWLDWAQRVAVARPQHGAVLVVQSGTIMNANASPENEGEAKVSVLLDFNFVHLGEQPLFLSVVPQWLETAHDEVESMFEKSLTAQSKQLLGYKENHEANS